MTALKQKIMNDLTREWEDYVLPDVEEYLRRNLLHAGAIGAKSVCETTRDRLLRQKRPPKWLLDQIDLIQERVEPTIPDLAKWRGVVGYVPAETFGFDLASPAFPQSSETPDKSETEASISKNPSSTDGFLAVAS